MKSSGTSPISQGHFAMTLLSLNLCVRLDISYKCVSAWVKTKTRLLRRFDHIVECAGIFVLNTSVDSQMDWTARTMSPAVSRILVVLSVLLVLSAGSSSAASSTSSEEDDSSSSTAFTDQWAVHISGGDEVADAIAARHGFTNLGKVMIEHSTQPKISFQVKNGYQRRRRKKNRERKRNKEHFPTGSVCLFILKRN